MNTDPATNQQISATLYILKVFLYFSFKHCPEIKINTLIKGLNVYKKKVIFFISIDTGTITNMYTPTRQRLGSLLNRN